MDNNYASWPADRLRREAAERAGWTDVHVKSYGHARVMWGTPPGGEPGDKGYDLVPDYTGSVDAALGLPGLANIPYGIELDHYGGGHTPQWYVYIRYAPEGKSQFYKAWHDNPATAIVIAWLMWQDARASEERQS